LLHASDQRQHRLFKLPARHHHCNRGGARPTPQHTRRAHTHTHTKRNEEARERRWGDLYT
jgi:hypothetical protein